MSLELRERVLEDASDTEAWDALIDEFDARDQPGRALACAQSLCLANPADARRAEIGERSARTRQRVFETESEIRTALAEPDQKSVSVIMPTYNRLTWLERALRSVLDQTFTDFEIIVVNDGGDPEAEAIVRSLQSDQIRYVYAENGGLSVARNRGFLRARGKYIAYLDDDDQFYPHHLETLVGHLERTGSVFARSRAVRLTKAPDGGRWRVERAQLPFRNEVDRRTRSLGNFTPVLAVVHRRDALIQTGVFDPEIFSVQDWDLWLRFSDRFDLEHVPVITAEYDLRLDPSSMQGGRPVDHDFHALLIRNDRAWRARGWKRRAEHRLAMGDASSAGEALSTAWDLGIEATQYRELLQRLARVSRRAAWQCAARAGRDYLNAGPGGFSGAARLGSFVERTRGRAKREWLLRRYAAPVRKGVSRARESGFGVSVHSS